MKAVIYARFSSDKQNEKSIDGQLRECMEYANFHDIQIVGNYIDRAFSAKTDQRPEFQHMIKDSAKNLFEMIIVWKLDRFARNRYDSAYYKNILKKNGVRVVSAKEVIAEGPEGIILESMLEGMAEYYSAELSEKVKRGMTENALKAKANGVRAPFGYYVDSDDHYQIEETTSPIVKEIFTLYVGGTKAKDIVDILNARGIKNRGYAMNYNSIFRILTNRKYIGEYKFGDVVLENAIPAIIDKELFDKAQDKLKTNKKAPAMHRGEDAYLLTTKLFCGKCGAMMTGESGTSHTTNTYRYYKCNHARKKTCDKKTVKKDWIEDLVLEQIKELVSSDEVIEELASRIYEMQAEENTTITIVKNKLAEVKKKLNNLAEAIANGIYSPTTKQLLDDLESQKSNLENELYQEQSQNPIISKDQIEFALFNYRKLDLTKKEDRQQLIDSFVNSIYLYDDYFVITFNYKNQSKTVSFELVNSSSLTSNGSPNGNNPNTVSLVGDGFGFIIYF